MIAFHRGVELEYPVGWLPAVPPRSPTSRICSDGRVILTKQEVAVRALSWASFREFKESHIWCRTVTSAQ